MRLKYLFFPLSLTLFLSSSCWSAQVFKIEPGWSQVEFDVKNFGLHTVDGHFKTFSGTIFYDDVDVTRSSVTAAIQISSIDTGSKKRDSHLQTPDFFEASSFPQMMFQSVRIEKKGDGYVLVGRLTIKGHVKEVEWPFSYSIEKSPQGALTLHAEAHGAIDRHDFGIDYGSNFSVGSMINIRIHIQAVPQ
jgi:polyisoprenoid-binding protein YceI